MRPPSTRALSASSPGAPRSRSAWSRRLSAVVLTLTVVAVVGLVSAAFVIQSTSGSANGVQSGSAFLTHWQQTAVLSTATPFGALPELSTTAAAPTRLAAASAAYRLDAATARDVAVEWVFTESIGIGTNLEIEMVYSVAYTLAGTTHTVSGTAYLESPATAPGVADTFDLYWDAGVATGVTFGAESEISQACSAVGACP